MRKLNIQNLVLVAALACLGGISSGQEQNIQFGELENKLTFDRDPVKSVNGVIASYAPALETATPAVITIESTKKPTEQTNAAREELLRRLQRQFPQFPFPDEFPDDRGQEGLGSGVIISADGYALTNNHVVGGADEIKITLSNDRKQYDAVLVGADEDTDVALIKIQNVSNLQPIRIGDSSLVRVGDIVLAVGNPFGLEQTVTHGIVSALGRRSVGITRGGGGYENFIQTDASINKGNSGGALIDAQGRLVGVNTAIHTGGGMSAGNVGIGFAIPSNMVLSIVRRLLDGGGKVRRGFLGVGLDDVDSDIASALGREDLKGALIKEVNEGTPAAVAGLKPGDLVIEFDGKQVIDASQLRLNVSRKDPGTEVGFKLIRKGKERNVSVVLGDKEELMAKIRGRLSEMRQRPAEPVNTDFLDGVTIRDLDDNLRTALNIDDSVQGVFVDEVQPGTDAAQHGLQAGQVITQLDQQNTSSVREAKQILSRFDGQVILIQVYKEGRRSILAVPMN